LVVRQDRDVEEDLEALQDCSQQDQTTYWTFWDDIPKGTAEEQAERRRSTGRTALVHSRRTGRTALLLCARTSDAASEVAYNDTRGHGHFKATRPESPKEKKKKGVALLP